MAPLFSISALLAVPTEGARNVESDPSATQGFVEEAINAAVTEAILAFVFGISVMIAARFLGVGGTKPKSPKRIKVAKATRVRKPVDGATTTSPTESDRESAHSQPSTAPTAHVPKSRRDPTGAATGFLAAAACAGKAAQLPQLLDTEMARLAQPGPLDSGAKAALAARLLSSSVRACASKRYFREALAAYNHMEELIGSGDTHLWSLLLWSAMEAGESARGDFFARKLCATGDISQHDFVNLVRSAVHHQDTKQLVEILDVCRASGMTLDVVTRNRALAALASGGAMGLAAELVARTANLPLDVVSYNILMKGHALRKPKLSLQLYEQMRGAGLVASDVTYGILLDACVGGAMLEDARRIFDDLRSSGRPANVVHYTTYIKGLVAAGSLAEARDVLAEMHATPRAKPDLVTYTTLAKAYAAAGCLSDCIQLLEMMRCEGVEPDDVLVNISLSACCAKPMAGNKILGAFERVVGMGFRPTSSTYSVLIKACAGSARWGVALDLLRGAHSRFGIVPEVRVYTQLAQACASARAASELVETQSLLVQSCRARGEALDAATKLRFVRLAAACGVSDGSVLRGT